MRVRYGLPIFVTFSPDEAHQLLYVRLCRTRQSDPGYTRSASEDAELGGRCWPQLCDDLRVPVAKLIESTRASPPDWWRRRGALARDPLASVDGFRMLVTLALRHLFGVRFCWKCPDCASSSSSCQDLCGSNAAANGGVFGRADGIYVAVEAQNPPAACTRTRKFLSNACTSTKRWQTCGAKLRREPRPWCQVTCGTPRT